MRPIVLTALPSISPSQVLLLSQFFRFGTVGIVGLFIDTAIVYGLRGSMGLYGAGLVSYVVAASCNWLLNRLWTFKGHGTGKGSAHRQWAMFMITNLLGFILNRGTYAALVTFVAIAADQPVIATAAGSVAGMFVNFTLSRRVVFR